MTPHRAAAEYLALTIARREGYGPGDADRLAHLTGLPVMDCSRLVRSRDLTEIHRRRIQLDNYTLRGPQ